MLEKTESKTSSVPCTLNTSSYSLLVVKPKERKVTYLLLNVMVAIKNLELLVVSLSTIEANFRIEECAAIPAAS